MLASAPATRAQVAAHAANVSHTLNTLEKCRALLGNRPLVMNSLVRTPEDNADADGSLTSGHLDGSAVDFYVPATKSPARTAMAPETVMQLLAPNVPGLGIDQLILYKTHVHVGTGPKKRGQLLDARFGKPLRAWTPSGTIPPAQADATRATAAAPGAPGGPDDGLVKLLVAAVTLGLCWLFLALTK